ncbi:hypothetical protein RDWZM_004101 [Blomia tropicalis]|uniref:Zinc transporter 2-like n=1 Tax=Blomia tropicalis TaxID=40697 RepID=A0A9Q0MGL1_BLOTA|nr:hypothetical protein RDWZM_004101 [Blomia tropicalis]
MVEPTLSKSLLINDLIPQIPSPPPNPLPLLFPNCVESERSTSSTTCLQGQINSSCFNILDASQHSVPVDYTCKSPTKKWFRSKLLEPFSKDMNVSSANSSRKFNISILEGKPINFQLDPNFDYKMVDDINAEELIHEENLPIEREITFTDISLGINETTIDQENNTNQNEECNHNEGNLSYNSHCHDRSMEEKIESQTKGAITKLIIGSIICLIFMLIEIVGGYLSSSLAIFTDAAHLTSDLASFGISLAAIVYGRQRPTQAKSFGYHRLEVLGVLVSVFSIWSMTAILLYLAFGRIIKQDFELQSETMLIVSIIGLSMNIVMMFTLTGGFKQCWKIMVKLCLCCLAGKHLNRFDLNQMPNRNSNEPESLHEHSHDHGHSHSHGHSHFGSSSHGHSHMNMNVRAAVLHIIGDIIQSVGVLIAAIVVHFWPHLKLADPICTIIFSIIVFLTTYQIMRDALHILMEGFPREFQYESVRRLLLDQLPKPVVNVHSLHIWTLTHGRNALTVHLTIDRFEPIGNMSNDSIFDHIRQCAEKIIRKELKINHTTIQIEYHQQQLIETCETCIGPIR